MASGHAVYTIKQGDTLSQIVDKFKKGNLFDRYYKVNQNLSPESVWNDKKNIPLALSRKQPSRIRPGDVVYLPFQGTEIEISIPFGKEVNLAMTSTDRLKIQPFPFVPVVDIHMHVQSLHATPLPIMYNTAYYKTYNVLFGLAAQKTIGQTRFQMTETSAGFLASLFAHDFGKIGRFSTDLIAKIFMQDAKNNEMKQSLLWVLKNTDEEVAKYIEKCNKKKKSAEAEAGGELKLEELSVERQKLTTEYYKSMTYYFAKKQVFQIACMMPMDLSYAHFWGHHGIPIYIPDDKGDGFYHIDDFQLIKHSSFLGFGKVINVEDCYEPFFNKDKDHTSMFFEKYLSWDIDLNDDFKTYVDWVLTNYISSPEAADKAYESMVFSFEHTPFATGKTTKEAQKKYVLDTYEKELKKKYKHFVRRINGDSSERFEDYYLQDAYTEASGFRYPLQLIPFYHYDPRRYYTKGTDLESKADNIGKMHAFFDIRSVESKFKKGYGKLADITMSVINGDYLFKNLFSDATSKDFDGQGENVTRLASCKPHEDIEKKLFPNGPCLGVKMYPALGYPPNLYINPHKNDTYADRQFNNLRKLFEFCAKNKIPVTAHCSPLGMTIADGFNYMFRDEKEKKDKYPIEESALYLDKINGHPDNWDDVIRDFPELRINLAHFGGMGQWYSSEKDLRNKYGDTYYDSCVKTWKDKIADLASSKPNVYTDISCYTFNSSRGVPYQIIDQDMTKILGKCSLRQKSFIRGCYWFNENEYTWYLRFGISDVDRYQVIDILETIKYIRQHEEFRNLAANLKKAISDKNLRNKVLMGSDWYMSELSGLKGTGVYQGRMFELLRYITKEMNDEYDVWHQFAVVNNLCFLGFLETDSSGKPKTEDFKGRKVCIWNRQKVKKYLEMLEKMKDDDAIKRARVLTFDDEKNFKDRSDLRFEQLMHSKIFDASQIKDSEGALLITSIVG